MEYGNSITVDGHIENTGTILSRNIVIQKDISDNIGDIVIDFSECNAYTVDLRGAIYNGISSNLQIALTNAVQKGTIYKVRILQTDSTPLPANMFVSFVSGSEIQSKTAIEQIVNVESSITTIVFDYIQLSGTEVYVPINISTGTAYTENTNYTSNSVISDGDAYTEALSKLDQLLGRLIPSPPPLIETKSLILYSNTSPMYSTIDGSIVNVLLDDVYYGLTGPSAGSQSLNNVELLTAKSDNVSIGQINPQSAVLTDQNLSIYKGTYGTNNFYETIGGLELYTTGIPDSINQHTISLEYTYIGESVAVLPLVYAYICRRQRFPIPANPTQTRLEAAINPTRMVSGMVSFNTGDIVAVYAKYNNVSAEIDTYGFYGMNIGQISGIGVATSDVSASVIPFADMQTNLPNTPVLSKDLTVLSNAFANPMILTVKSRSLSNYSVGQTVQLNGSNQSFLLDTVTNTGSMSYEFDHSVDLTTNSSLMILNGIVQYPSGNHTSNYGGKNYASITGWRSLVSKPISAAGFSRVRVTLSNAVGFTGGLESSANYRMSVTRSDKPGEIYDGNVAYDGVGVVANGEGCLVLADSTSTQKVVTCGEVLPAGVTLTITISLLNTTKSFSQNITYIAY